MVKKEAVALVKRYVKFLVDHDYKIKQAYLFGSYSKGANNEDSDMDVAIFIEDLKDGFSTMLQLMKYRRQFDLKIEPHVLDAKDIKDQTPFTSQILKTGIKVF